MSAEPQGDVSPPDLEAQGDSAPPNEDAEKSNEISAETQGDSPIDEAQGENTQNENVLSSNKDSDDSPLAPMFLTAMFGKTLENVAGIAKTFKAEWEEITNSDEAYSPRLDMMREVCTMLDNSVLVASYAALRQLARENKLIEADLILNLPATISDVMRCVNLNLDAVKAELGKDRYGVFESFLDMKEKSLEESAVRAGTTYAALEKDMQQGVFHFGDKKANEELVYAIFLDGIRKRVVVAFRGTTTKIDLKQDLRAVQEAIESPFKHIEGMSDNVRLHLGFYEYLFSDERKEQEERFEESVKAVDQDTSMTEEQKLDRRALLKREKTKLFLEIEKLEDEYGESIESKCDLIFSQAAALLKKNPGFELYITGHSMGGALATLFSAVVAVRENQHIPKPITCISFSSPKVGNVAFKQAYEKLEKDNLIRKVRVLNGLDPIPKTPSAGFLRILFYALCPWSLYDTYSHVGIELKLKESGYQITYNRHRGTLWLLLQEFYRVMKGFGYFFYLIFLCRITKLLKYHSCSEIVARLQDNGEALQKESINDLYERIKKGETGILSFKLNTKVDLPTKRKTKEKTKRKAQVIHQSALPAFTESEVRSDIKV